MSASRIALVSGANKGLGWETSRQLAEMEITVLMGARDFSKGQQAADRLGAMGLSVAPIQLDVTRADHIARVRAHIDTHYGRLDILVNNAGIIHPEEPLFANSSEQVSLQALRDTFEVNFLCAPDRILSPITSTASSMASFTICSGVRRMPV